MDEWEEIFKKNSELGKTDLSQEDIYFKSALNFIKPDSCEDSINSIPFLGGRPKRDTVINSDDIANLNIALNMAKTFKEFIELV